MVINNSINQARSVTANGTFLGINAGNSTLSGTANTAIGNSALNIITTGSNNIALGYLAASAYTTSESSNINIGNIGSIGESNVLRIGTNGSGAGASTRWQVISSVGNITLV